MLSTVYIEEKGEDCIGQHSLDFYLAVHPPAQLLLGLEM